MRVRVLVTGAAGQLGAEIVRAFADCDVIAHDRGSLDITDNTATSKAVAEAAPQLVINCAAFNDVDRAETAPLDALDVNAFAVRTLARAAARAGATFVHYSTDFVFDGETTEPYDEQAAPRPLSTYGASKLLGEWFAGDVPRAFVLRVESLFGTPADWRGRRGTLDRIISGLTEGREVRVFTDRVVSPTYIVDIAAATRYLVERNAAPGLYHCVNSGHASWHDVAAEAARILGVTPRLVPTTAGELALKANRPRFCALSPQKLAAAGFVMPTWRDALRRWLAGRAVPAA